MISREGKKTLATELRHRIAIQSVVKTADGEGGFTETWATVLTCWAAIYPMRAEMRYEYQTINVIASHLVKIRGDISISEDNRIKFGSRVFDVLTVENAQEAGIVKWIACNERR